MRVLFVFLGFFGWFTLLQAQPPERDKSPLAAIERRLQAVHETVAPAIVRIAGKGLSGSGIIVTADGYVVTKCGTPSLHQGAPLAVFFADGRRVSGISRGWSGEWMIGLMKITEQGPWPHVTLGNTVDVKAGQLCVALEYPLVSGVGFARQPALCLGCVTKSAAPNWFTSSCAVDENGSGVFDLEGRLLGVTTRLFLGRDPIHTSVELIKEHWDDLSAGKNLDHVRLSSSEKRVGKTLETKGLEPQPFAEKDRFSAAIEKARPATVRILADHNRWSGVIVSADGYVVTCAHCEPLPSEKVTICLPDGRDAAGKVLGANWVSDVALLKITEKGPWPSVELGDSTVMRIDDPCVRMGYPSTHRGRQPLVQNGRVVEREDLSWSCRLSTSTGPTHPGESGGGIFDLKGRVVAVHFGGENRESNVVRHGRIELFRKQWDFLVAGKPVDVISSEPLGEVAAAFRRVAKDLESSVVVVLGDKKQRALGTIVRNDGRILTKASELHGAISCRFADGRILPATIERVSREHDLAVLRVDATRLPAVEFGQSDGITTGSLIAAFDPGKTPLVSVVSRPAGPVAPDPGWLGEHVFDGDRGLEVATDQMARRLGLPLRTGDVIVRVEGQRTPDMNTYLKVMEPREGVPIAYPGDPIGVVVKRGDERLKFRFTLAEGYPPRGYGQSERNSAFPSVFETRTPLAPNLCGGPVMDKTGRVAGIAIACRESNWIYVIPATVAKKVIAN